MTQRYQDHAFKLFIFCADLSIDDLYEFDLFIDYPTLKLTLGSMLHHAYFISNDEEVISISTIEWFFTACNKPYITRLFTFVKESMKWNGTLYQYEKFHSYQGCELTLMLPYKLSFGLNTYHWGYSIINKDESFTIKGIVPKIFKIAAQKYNFTDTYSPVGTNVQRFMNGYKLQHIFVAQTNNTTYKLPNVYFNIDDVQSISYDQNRLSLVFYDLKFKILVTPADRYTPYEKLFLPFDFTTWLLLVATFAITFLTIFVINHLPKSAREFVYGREICTPTLNVISIFFGISQARLPSENFSRSILILFVFFCLIFRTCFQSKSFEFLTSEPRRPPPRSVNDLLERNYTVRTINTENFEFLLREELYQW